MNKYACSFSNKILHPFSRRRRRHRLLFFSIGHVVESHPERTR